MAEDPFAGRSEITAAEYLAVVGSNGDAPITHPMSSRPKGRGRDHTAALQGIRESAFRDEVVAHAKDRGWLVYWTWNSKHSPAGFPDLVMFRAGRLIFAELKVGRNKTTADQAAWLNALAQTKGDVWVDVWYPEDWDEIERMLR